MVKEMSESTKKSIWQLNRLFFWLRCARYHSWKQSFVPGILALMICSREQEFSWQAGILAVFGAVLAHMGANLLDDYFDFQSGCVESRRKMIDGGMRARSRKCSYITSGETTTRELLCAGVLFCLLATVIGIYLTLLRGIPIFWCILAGGIPALFYSAPPLRLSFHGLGELTVALLFGPILMTGVSYSACGRLVPSILPVSISAGLLVGNILYTHSVLDMEPDRRAGKRTLAVLCGNVRNAVWGSALFLAAIYLSVLTGVAFHIVPYGALLVLISLPLAIELWRLLRLFAMDPDRKVSRSFWMGPMEHWEMMVKCEIDWFMIRWFLSRNLMTLFCVLLAISFILERIFPS